MPNTSSRVLKLAGLATVFALATGFTNCAQFSRVTVPATDTSVPFTFTGVNQSGSWLDSAVNAPLTYHMTPGQRAFAVGAGMDGGGLRKLTMFSSETLTCCKNHLCSTSTSSSVPQSETQAGGPGSQVSDGIYLFDFVVLPTCSAGSTMQFRHSWFVVAEDFFGHTFTSPGAAMVYP